MKTLSSEMEQIIERKREYARQAEAYQAAREAEEARRRCEEAWSASGVPARHRSAIGLRNNAEGLWVETYHDLRRQLGEGLIVALLGLRGTGKTQLAACLCRDVCEQGRTARYVKAMDLFRSFREAMKDGRESSAHHQLRRISLLVIDEAHERGNTDFEDRTLVSLIDHRYDAMRDTIIIANQDKATFAESMGASVVSRIHECGKAIVCDWGSFRASN